MQQIVDLTLSPKQSADVAVYKGLATKKAGLKIGSEIHCRIIHRSIDARGKAIKVNLKILLSDKNTPKQVTEFHFKEITNAPEVIVVGAGPAGLFAALRLVELGLRPLIFERGKEVSDRKRDLAAIHRNQPINTDSNYGFGEGGAGAFSDGKLYTRSNKRGNIKRILELLYFHGASEEILYDAHPHIGTDKLPGIIASIRKTITQAGGKYFFNTRVSGFEIHGNQICGIITSDGLSFRAKAVILATGHSARDVYEGLNFQNIALEEKGFAMGVRVEHPQNLINRIQYHNSDEMQWLPAASYTLTSQIQKRGVYSFCMCPGGFIVPASTAPGERVVNGMSASRRNTPFANSGIVVEIRPEDVLKMGFKLPLAGMRFQQHFETLSNQHGQEYHIAPAQRVIDFMNRKKSASLPESSYRPGLISSPLHEWIPDLINFRLREAFKLFDQKMRGFIMQDALIVGVESRTSSPLRIPRNDVTLQHIQIQGLFPCGEGAGYAGGIVSSAMDGEKVAESIAQQIFGIKLDL